MVVVVQIIALILVTLILDFLTSRVVAVVAIIGGLTAIIVQCIFNATIAILNSKKIDNQANSKQFMGHIYFAQFIKMLTVIVLFFVLFSQVNLLQLPLNALSLIASFCVIYGIGMMTPFFVQKFNSSLA